MSRPLPEKVQNAARAHFDLTVRDITTPLSADEMRASLRDFDAVVPTLGDLYGPKIFAEVPNPRCRLLANFGVGYNHIDVTAAQATGIAVSNTPGAVTDATADIALCLMLMTARRAGEGERLLRAGVWEGWHPTQLLGLHLSGKTVGVVGMGRIGEAIARRCYFGFGMAVAYQSRSPKTLDFPARAYPSLKALASDVDALVIAVPGGAETHHLIGAEVFQAMRPHAFVVNIARGNVVDEAALIAALETGEIAGAGLDVYEFEPQVPPALTALENVTLLPHLGTAALEVREDMGMMCVNNLIAFFDKKPLPNGIC